MSVSLEVADQHHRIDQISYVARGGEVAVRMKSGTDEGNVRGTDTKWQWEKIDTICQGNVAVAIERKAMVVGQPLASQINIARGVSR